MLPQSGYTSHLQEPGNRLSRGARELQSEDSEDYDRPWMAYLKFWGIMLQKMSREFLENRESVVFKVQGTVMLFRKSEH